MHRLIPSFIIEKFECGEFNGDFQATTMFIDIAGFSAMTQVLMNNGKEGAEVLADVINRVLTPAIEAIYEQCGFVSSFAGDAFTTIFPSDSVAVVNALSAAVRLQALIRDEGRQQTKFGSFVLSVRISLSCGSVIWGIIPHKLQNAFYFGGGAIMRCTGNKQQADSGEVIVDEKVLSQIAGLTEVTCIQKTSRFYSLQSAPIITAKGIPETPVPASRDRFIPQEILSLSDRGEFRDIVSCFISFDEKGDLATGIAKVITLAHNFGGYFNKIDFSDKSGIMLVLFGAPVNPGNLYDRALDFALAIRETPELSARMGLTYGTAFTGFVGSELRSEYTALGSVVNLSARFTQKKKRSVIYLDQSIYKQTRSHYEILELKPRRFKGFKGKTPIYRLTGKKIDVQVSVFEGSMVGRDSELNLLAEFLQPVKDGKFGGIVYVYGNPGIGKSRLAYELIQRHGIRALSLQTDSILRKPLNPFTYFFNHYFEQAEEGSSNDRKARFKTIYQELIGRIVSLSDAEKRVKTIKELNRIESIIGSIIGLLWAGSVYDMINPEDRAVVTQLAIKEFFTALSLTEPIILLIEDIQWLDDESQAVFEILTRHIEDYPFIILACSRFNDDGLRPELKADDDVPRHEITLDELSGEATKVLIEARLGKKTDEELDAYIRTRTEGNPFYTEQFCLYLLENSVIMVQDGQYRLIKELTDIPTDINMILISRIDRLSAELKETVQVASVLGREFEVQVLTALIKLIHMMTPDAGTEIKDSEIRPLITQIERKRIWSALTELKYVFTHALLRDAAYDMQLRARLRNMHRLAGDAIVNLYPDDKAIYADSAHHYEQAEDWDKAREYCQRAGKYFYESFKYDEALAYRQKALSICQKTMGEKHPDTATSYNSIGEVLSDKGDYDTALIYNKKALSIRKELLGEKHPETAVSYDKCGDIYWRKGNYDMALVDFKKALAIQKELMGEKHPESAESYNSIGAVYLDKGDYDTALAYYEKALEIWKISPSEKYPDTACSYNNIGHVYSVKGDYDTALTYYEKALALQKEILSKKHLHTATLYNNIGSVYWKKGDYDTALTYNEKAIAMQKELLGEKHPSTALSYNNIGMSHWRKGNYDTALAYYIKALAIRKELLGEKHLHTATSYNNIGGVHRHKGDQDKALAYYESALAIQKELLGEKHPQTAISLGNIASVYIYQGRYKDAEQLYRQVLTIFTDSLGKKHPYTIKTLKYMADMYKKTDNEQEAKRIREQLKDICGESSCSPSIELS